MDIFFRHDFFDFSKSGTHLDEKFSHNWFFFTDRWFEEKNLLGSNWLQKMASPQFFVSNECVLRVGGGGIGLPTVFARGFGTTLWQSEQLALSNYDPLKFFRIRAGLSWLLRGDWSVFRVGKIAPFRARVGSLDVRRDRWAGTVTADEEVRRLAAHAQNVLPSIHSGSLQVVHHVCDVGPTHHRIPRNTHTTAKKRSNSCNYFMNIAWSLWKKT